MHPPLVVLDTETATLSGPPHLLEVGAVRVEDGELVGHFERLVLPQVPIEPEASAIHGIEEAHVRAAAPAAEVLGELLEFAGDAWFAAHNARFDARVLAFELARAGLEPPAGPWVDTLALTQRAFPEAPDHKLATLVELLDLDAGTLHRALADAVACWQVLERAVERLGGFEALGTADWLGGGRAPLSLKGLWPARPTRPPARVRSLERAQADGALITIAYGGALGEPARLRVRPRFLFQHRDKGYLEAEEAASGLLKTYRLDRIQRVEAN